MIYKFFKFHQYPSQLLFWVLLSISALTAFFEITLLTIISKILVNSSDFDITAIFIFLPFIVLMLFNMTNWMGILLANKLSKRNNLKLFKFFTREFLSRKSSWNQSDIQKYLINMSNRVHASGLIPFSNLITKIVYLCVVICIIMSTFSFKVIPYIALFGFLILIFIALISPLYEYLGRNHMNFTNNVIHTLDDFFSNFKFVLANKMVSRVSNEYDKAITGVYNSQVKLFSLPVLIKTVIECCIFTLLIVIVFTGFQGDVGNADMVTFAFIVMRLMPVLQVIWLSIGQIQSVSEVFDKIYKCINRLDADITVKKDTFLLSRTHSAYQLSNHKIILPNFKLNIHGNVFDLNSKVLITAKSGAGKSTFFDYLVGLGGLLEGNKQQVFNDNLKIAYCPQVVSIFEDSILRNLIPKGAPDPCCIDNMNRFLVKFDLANTIEKFGGLEATIGRNSNPFSGGQLKRFGIVRALLADADVFLFDEPEAGLDKANRSKVIEEILKLDKLVFVISHVQESKHSYTHIASISNGEIWFNAKND